MNPQNLQGKPLTMLHVEDNPDHAELVQRSLENHHVANEIYWVSDGLAALDYLHRRGDYADPATSPRPDVILLDLRLPKIDGIEVLKQIKESENFRSIPVVVLTSSSKEKDVDAAYQNYVNSYVVKPVDFEKFAKLLSAFPHRFFGSFTIGDVANESNKDRFVVQFRQLHVCLNVVQ